MNGFDITSGFLIFGSDSATVSTQLETLPRPASSSLRNHSLGANLQIRLWALRDLEFFRSGEVGAENGVGGGYFGDRIRVKVVGSKRQVFTKGDFELVSVPASA